MSDALNDQKEFDKMQWRRETHPEHFNNLHDDNKYRVPKTGTYMVGNQKIEVTDGVCIAVKGIEPAGIKHDQGKVEYHHMPAEAFEEINKALTYGSKKYSDFQWRAGFIWSRPFNACMRHLWAYWRGEDIDKESGCYHLACAAANVIFLLQFLIDKKGIDNRYKQQEIK